MKGPLDRTKVVLRHLPPSITQAMLMDQIDNAFAGRYNRASFRPGKSSQKHLIYSRAYINFNRADDVIKFAEFFDGHVFVNEKGTQYKTIVEYAPSQRVPKRWTKKDGREGTILKDPEYMEVLEVLANPVENLPSAEVQLERREAEHAGAAKDAPVVTTLMDYVRQKRASKGVGRLMTRKYGIFGLNSMPVVEAHAIASLQYVLRDNTRNYSSKNRSSYALYSKRDEQQHSERSTASPSASRAELMEENSGGSEINDSGKKKIILLKGGEKEISHVSGSISQAKASFKQNHRHEVSGRVVISILRNKDAQQSQPENQTESSYSEKEKRLPRLANVQEASKDTNGLQDEKAAGNELPSFGSEKQERRTRNKERPDRGVWAPLRRSNGSYASDESSSTSLFAKSPVDSTEGIVEVRILGHRRSNHSLDNGFHNVGRRGQTQGGRDVDVGSVGVSEGKPSKRGEGLLDMVHMRIKFGFRRPAPGHSHVENTAAAKAWFG